MSEQTGRGGGRTEEQIGRGGGRTGDQVGRGNGSNGGVDEVPEFSIVIPQQLQDLLPVTPQKGPGRNTSPWANKDIIDEYYHELTQVAKKVQGTPRIIESIPIVFPLANSIVYLRSEAVGTMSLRSPLEVLSSLLPWLPNIRPDPLSRGSCDYFSNQGINKCRNDNADDDSIHEDVRNVNVKNGQNGCLYKEFVACKPKEFDYKGGVVAYTHWVKKMEAIQDISGCGDNQKVKYSAGLLIGKAMTWWNSQNAILKAEVLTDEPVRNGFLKKSGEKRGYGRESSKEGNFKSDNNRTRTRKGEAQDGNSTECQKPNSSSRGHGNNGNPTRGRSFVIGAEEARQDPNIMTDIKLNSLGLGYKIEIAIEQLVEINKVIRDCKLEIEGYTFNIDLIPFEHESFDVIIGMDWLSMHKAKIIFHEKVVRISLPRGEMPRVHKERLDEKAKHLMSAKAEEQKLKDIIVVRNISENKKYVWGDEQETTFQTLKDKLCNAPILALPNGPEDCVVYCNASCQGLGCSCIRSQDIETLLVREEDHYNTDHKSLQHIFDQKELNMHQRRWIELFSDYDCEIRYHPAQNKASEIVNAPTEMLQGLDEQMKHESDRALYYGSDMGSFDEKYRSPILWGEVKEGQLIGPKIIQETTEKISQIKDQHKAIHDHKMSVVRFGKKGKLAPRFVRPFEITERISQVAYRLRLPQELSSIHDMVHVSNLKKCIADPTLHVPLEEIHVDAKLNFIEEPVEILGREIKKLKRSRILIVKIQKVKYVCNYPFIENQPIVAGLEDLLIDLAAEILAGLSLARVTYTKNGFPGVQYGVRSSFLGAGKQLMRLQILHLELRLGKNPYRSFRPVKSVEYSGSFGHQVRFGFHLLMMVLEASGSPPCGCVINP
uniref:Putative reverse transcriptase domain-containing protein n=1 Tax=Tanacetum cinerariifolium TaxID=118510 RepID=A0A6L2K0L8_TANCI|nr:putative reverse transcriptase domain-containing protein [Tanacetum cinerariifolium]